MSIREMEIAEQYEENHCLWWMIDGIRAGQNPERRKGFSWTLLADEGWASLHKLRLTPKLSSARRMAQAFTRTSRTISCRTIWSRA